MLEKKIKAYENDKTSISCFSLIKELPKMKKNNFEWLKEKKLFLAKIGLIEIRGFREFDGELKTVTVSKEANQYYASLLFDDGEEFKKPKHNGKKVGIDVGVALFATLSNGKTFKPLKLDKVIKKMKKAQKSLSSLGTLF